MGYTHRKSAVLLLLVVILVVVLLGAHYLFWNWTFIKMKILNKKYTYNLCLVTRVKLQSVIVICVIHKYESVLRINHQVL